VSGPRPIAVHAVTRGGVALAARLAARLGAQVHVPERLAAVAPPGATTFPLPLRAALAPAFGAYRGHVFVMAAGAVVRLLAPLLQDKRQDPAVVCVDEAGRFAISLLSGHLGGANALAEEVAAALGALPVITTASDVRQTLAVDLLGRELGWRFEDPHGNAARAARAVVEGAPVLLVQEAGEPGWWPEARALPANVTRAPSLAAWDPLRHEALLLVTDRLPRDEERERFARAVLYRPRSLVVGVGCDRGAPPDLVARGVESLLARTGLSAASVRAVATVDLKAAEPALLALAARYGEALRTFTAAELDATPGIERPSEQVRRLVGTRAVAEAAALRAAGADRLLVPKQVYTEPGAGRSMTLAVARLPFAAALGGPARHEKGTSA
jgi:cobalt-precorrin 5A hydrolase